jgi:carbon-monoxide dehydrogenase medium subunit
MDYTEYAKPADLHELLALLARREEGTVFIAGGTNLIPQMRSGEKSPAFLIDICELPELNHIKEENGLISIGATTTIAELTLNPLVANYSPILASAAKQLGNPLTRNRATIGGNLANASPCADTAPPLLVLDASLHILGPGGKVRQVEISKFFHGYKFTDLAKDELITRVTFPKPKGSAKGCHTKMGLRNCASVCVASVAVMIEIEGGGCRKARIAAGSVAPIPLRAWRTEEFLQDKIMDEVVLEQCSALIKDEISPISDIRGSAAYRSYVVSTMLKRNLKVALLQENHK